VTKEERERRWRKINELLERQGRANQQIDLWALVYGNGMSGFDVRLAVPEIDGLGVDVIVGGCSLDWSGLLLRACALYAPEVGDRLRRDVEAGNADGVDVWLEAAMAERQRRLDPEAERVNAAVQYMFIFAPEKFDAALRSLFEEARAWVAAHYDDDPARAAGIFEASNKFEESAARTRLLLNERGRKRAVTRRAVERAVEELYRAEPPVPITCEAVAERVTAAGQPVTPRTLSAWAALWFDGWDSFLANHLARIRYLESREVEEIEGLISSTPEEIN